MTDVEIALDTGRVRAPIWETCSASTASPTPKTRLGTGRALGEDVGGYEIHHGRVTVAGTDGHDEEFPGGARRGHVSAPCGTAPSNRTASGRRCWQRSSAAPAAWVTAPAARVVHARRHR